LLDQYTVFEYVQSAAIVNSLSCYRQIVLKIIKIGDWVCLVPLGAHSSAPVCIVNYIWRICNMLQIRVRNGH